VEQDAAFTYLGGGGLHIDQDIVPFMKMTVNSFHFIQKGIDKDCYLLRVSEIIFGQ